ncbi:MAG: hypothetical protein LBR20_08300 [Propionibacteriaceae bacterium]|jgi:alternate signal-mediated exported protein|nr:hypothetical protein [Propionibacteriaceae bacterium]
MKLKHRLIIASLAAVVAGASTWALFTQYATSGAISITAGDMELNTCGGADADANGVNWTENSADDDGISWGSPDENIGDFQYTSGDDLTTEYCLRGVLKGDNLAGVLDLTWEGSSEDSFWLYTDSNGEDAGGLDRIIATGHVGDQIRITENEDDRLAAAWGDAERQLHWVLRINHASEFDPEHLPYATPLASPSATPTPDTLPSFKIRLTQTRYPVSGITGMEAEK